MFQQEAPVPGTQHHRHEMGYQVEWDTPTTDVSTSSENKAAVRTIRSRLAVRGFKDQDKGDVDRYAGTSSRCSQKLLVSEAVCRGWAIATTDINKAFLQGVTYEELAKLTGEPQREVNVYLPASNIPILRRVPGFEDFDPQKESSTATNQAPEQ